MRQHRFAKQTKAKRKSNGEINMPRNIRPKTGNGKLQWNAGSWLGASFGGTAWMIVAAGFLILNQEISVAVIPLCGFLVTSIFAYGLWAYREQLDPFVSIMVLLVVLSITTPVAWFSIRNFASPQTLAQMSWPSWYGWNVVVVLLTPGIMALFYVNDRRF